MTQTPAKELPPCLIHIDKDGKWYHEGVEMIHREFIRFFYQHLELDAAGRYVIDWKGQRCWVDVADTAFVVRRAVYEDGTQTQDAKYVLHLSDDTKEPLLPDTLYVGKMNVLYCKVKNRRFPARFDRAAYYQLARSIEEENGIYVLPLHGKKYKVFVGDQDSSG